MYSSDYDLEGLLATCSLYKGSPSPNLIAERVDAYEKVLPNLLKHNPNYPTAASLRKISASGQPSNGMGAVGVGKSSEGSKLIIAAVDKSDDRPLWVSAWGGTNTLAQALTDVRATRSTEELNKFISKIRLYTISDQCDAGPWMRKEFPSLFFIVSPGSGGSAFIRATWSGISSGEYIPELKSRDWIGKNIIADHGPLGSLYPQYSGFMEGDTPSWLGLIDNGLSWNVTPSNGGWGGRYKFSGSIWTDTTDTFEFGAGKKVTSNHVTIWRWQPDFQYDFAGRMDWCMADTFGKANHNPVLVLNGDVSKNVLNLSAKSGGKVSLSAEGTTDPDGNTVTLRWYIYQEAGTLPTGATLSKNEGLSTDVSLPAGATGKLHVILDADDNGNPPMPAYRRAVIDVTP
jgi:hypothetical protein